MSETKDNSLDLTGLGKAIEAIPDESWNLVFQTTCKTFSDLVSPLTELGSGVGRWLRQRFDSQIEFEKVLFADGLQKASEQIKIAGRQFGSTINLSTADKLVDGVSTCNDPDLRELWINLLSKELCEEDVHPAMIKALDTLSPADAKRLVELRQNARQHVFPRMRNVGTLQKRSLMNRFFRYVDGPRDLSDTVLKSLGLIEEDEMGVKIVTTFGIQFIAAVSPLEPPSEVTEGVRPE